MFSGHLLIIFTAGYYILFVSILIGPICNECRDFATKHVIYTGVPGYKDINSTDLAL